MEFELNLKLCVLKRVLYFYVYFITAAQFKPWGYVDYTVVPVLIANIVGEIRLVSFTRAQAHVVMDK